MVTFLSWYEVAAGARCPLLRGGEKSVVSNRGDEVASGYEVSSHSNDTIPPSDHEQTNINANFDSLMTREGVWDSKSTSSLVNYDISDSESFNRFE